MQVDHVIRTGACRAVDPRLGVEHLVEVSDLVAQRPQRRPGEIVFRAAEAHPSSHFRAKPEACGAAHVAPAASADAHEGPYARQPVDDLDEAFAKKFLPRGGVDNRLDLLD